METPLLGLTHYLFPLSLILEKVDDIDITLDDARLATGFPPSSPSVIFSPDFDDLACGTGDHKGITYKQFPTIATTRVINISPPSRI